MRTSGENLMKQNVRISDEAERVQWVSYYHIRSFSRLYPVMCLREGKRSTCFGPPISGALLNVFRT